LKLAIPRNSFVVVALFTRHIKIKIKHAMVCSVAVKFMVRWIFPEGGQHFTT